VKPVRAYTIACTSAAAVSALLTWLVNDTGVEAAPIASAIFGAFIGSFTIGNALRGSFLGDSGDRIPLGRRARWSYGLIGALVVIAFALGMSRLYAWHDRTFHDGP